ncbi:MAG TPA: hypothetical protein VGB77_12080 [Abditibacteriaceae bacterium]
MKQQGSMRSMKMVAMGFVLGATGVVSGLAGAQPNAGGGNAGNPPNQDPRGGRGNFPDMRNMTPEQRREAFRKWNEEREERSLRDTLSRAGFTQQAGQDIVVAFSKEQNAAQESLRTMAEKLVTGVSTPGVPDAEVARLLKELQDAVAKEKERRKTARTALNEKLSYTENPRLELMLTTLGLIGDDSLGLNSQTGRFGGFGGGFGGPGGGFGGGRGN